MRDSFAMQNVASIFFKSSVDRRILSSNDAKTYLGASACNGGVRRKTLATFGAQEALEIQESLEPTEGSRRPPKALEAQGAAGCSRARPAKA